MDTLQYTLPAVKGSLLMSGKGRKQLEQMCCLQYTKCYSPFHIPQTWWAKYTWKASSENTINNSCMNTQKPCNWVSKMEIGPISCRFSLNFVNGGTSLTATLGTRVLAACLVGLWGCVPSPPPFLKRETPFAPLPQVSHLSVECMCAAEDVGSHPLLMMYLFVLVHPMIHGVR